jgi:hypothetical protein
MKRFGCRPTLHREILEPSLCTLLSIDWLRTQMHSRSVLVEYCLEGIHRPRPDFNGGAVFRRLLPTYLALSYIEHPEWVGPTYYLSNVDLRDISPDACNLLADHLSAWLRTEKQMLFLGNAGTGSHTHYDIPWVTILCVSGRKHLRCFAPSLTNLLKPFRETNCCRKSSLSDQMCVELHKQLQKVAPDVALEFELTAGDALIIPAGWWHRVENRSLSIGLSLFDVCS